MVADRAGWLENISKNKIALICVWVLKYALNVHLHEN